NINALYSERQFSLVQSNLQVETKEKCLNKKYSFKLFSHHNKNFKDEFDHHLEIFKKIEKIKDKLIQMGVNPGVGIEKPPIATFQFNNTANQAILKHFYDKNLEEGIYENIFEDKNYLISAAKQLLQGLATLLEVGGFNFEIKLSNIRFRKKEYFEIVF